MKEYEQRATKIIMNTVEGVKAQIRKSYNKGYEDGQKEKLANAMIYDHEEAEKTAYEQGLNDAWDVAKKIYDMDGDTIVEVFDDYSPYNVTQKCTAAEAIAKIKAYEDKQKPKCANCRFFHKLKHNFEVGKGFVESHCCTIMLEHDFEPSVKDIMWVQEVEENSKCEMFTERGAEQ